LAILVSSRRYRR